LVNEILASRRARELVEDPSGLGAALATYAVPPLWAGLEGLGAYALARHLYKHSCAHQAKLERVKQLISRAAKTRHASQATPTV
jgi:hypothetical protein